jgi:hypothetical protein
MPSIRGRGAGGAVGTLLKNLQGEIAMIMAGGNANHDHDGHGGANPHAALCRASWRVAGSERGAERTQLDHQDRKEAAAELSMISAQPDLINYQLISVGQLAGRLASRVLMDDNPRTDTYLVVLPFE